MLGKIKKRLKEKKFLVCLLLALLLGIFWFAKTQAMQVDVRLSETDEAGGTMQLYYSTFKKGGYSEKHSLAESILDHHVQFRVSRGFCNSYIRLDPDFDSDILIESITVVQNGIQTQELSGAELAEQISESHNAAIEKENKGIRVHKEGEDPNFVLFLSGAGFCFWPFALHLLKAIAIFLVSGALFCGVTLFYEKDSEKCMKAVILASMLLIMGGVAKYGYQACQTAKENAAAEQSYIVLHQETVYKDAGGIQQGEFAAAAGNITHVDAWVDLPAHAEGKAAYEITDRFGNVVIKMQEHPLEDILNEEKTHLIFDVSSAELEQGETYTVHLQIETDDNITAAMEKDQLLLQQFYLPAYGNLIILSVIVIAVLIFVLLLLFWRFGMTERVFLAAALTIGVLAACIMPPCNRDDEFRHFVRVYDLADSQVKGTYQEADGTERGNIIVHDNGKAAVIEVPKEIGELCLLDPNADNYALISYYAETNQRLSLDRLLYLLQQPDSSDTVRVSEEATIDRGWINYWPQVLFVWFGKLLGVRFAFLYYLARIGQVVFAGLLGYLALRLCPEFKHVFWISYFVPNCIMLRSSCNSDGLLMAEIMLFFAYILHLRIQEKNVVSLKRLVILGVLLFSILIMKVPCGLICFGALFLLKKENFRILKKLPFMKYWKRIIAVGAGIAAAAFLAVCITGHVKEIVLAAMGGYLSAEHVEYIFQNMGTVSNLFLLKGKELMQQWYASLRGEFYIPYIWVGILALLFCKRRLKLWEKAWNILVLAGFLFLIVLAGYSLTPPDYGMIWGITYRYMLPAIPLVMLVLPFGTDRTQKQVERVYPIYIVGIAGASCILWISGFWV